MGKYKGNQASTPGRMTIMLIQLEGDDVTLQEGIRTFKEAMGRAIPQVASRSIAQAPAPPSIVALPGLDANGHVNVDMDAITPELVIDSPTASPVSSSPRTTKNPRQRSFPKMQIVKDLDLRPDGKIHFKVLMEEKQPKNQDERITLCVYYLRRVLEVEGVTACHIYTCMDDSKIRVPNDLPKTLHSIASRKGWLNASNSSAIEITTKGVNFIQHDLPRSGS